MLVEGHIKDQRIDYQRCNACDDQPHGQAFDTSCQ